MVPRTTISPLDCAWVCKVVLQASRTFASWQEMVSSDSHVIVKSIIANPIDGFHNGSEFQKLVILHVDLTIACRSFRIYPCMPRIWIPPNFPLLTLQFRSFQEQENSAFVWMALSKSNLSSTKDCQNCLNALSQVHLVLSLNSAFGELSPAQGAGAKT